MEKKHVFEEMDFATIGRRVKQRRLLFRLSAEELAAQAGIARYTVVRLENGHPCTKKTLDRIRSVLHLFTDQMVRPFPTQDKYVVHRVADTRWNVSIPKEAYQKRIDDDDPIHVNDPAERKRLGQVGFQPFFTAVLDTQLPGGGMEQAMMELHKPSWVATHHGEEFIYCLRGRVMVTVDGEECTLEQGDSMCFQAELPHQYSPADMVGPEDEPPLILLVVTLKSKRPKAT